MSGNEKKGKHSTSATDTKVWLKLENQHLLTAVLEHLSDGFLFTDPNGQVMLTNPALEQMLGRPAATLMGKPLPADLAPGIGPIIGQAMEAAPALAAGEISLDKGRQIQVNASAVEGERGELLGILATLRDVSHYRAAEQIKDTVLATVSHELRTPLVAIVGFAALAEKTLDERLAPFISSQGPKARRALARLADHIRHIVKSGQWLEQMVNDLLDLADMEANRLQWNMTDISLVDVIHAAMFDVMPQAEAKGLPIHLSLPPDLPVTRGDRTRLTQVVVNLLDNAVKFTDQGEIWVSAKTLKGGMEKAGTTTPLPQQGDYLVVSVADTGRGVAPETMPRLFEKFFQSSTSLTDKPPGAGLGLVLCREIVEHHGGYIWVESEPDKGSTFFFALPWDAQARPVQPILLRELWRWVAATAPESASPPTVLLAHANTGLQQLVERSRSPDGLTLFQSSDGHACRRILESKVPDLLMLDPFLTHLNVLRDLELPPTLLLATVEAAGGGLRVALGEVMPELAGVDLGLHSLPSQLALAWDDGQPNARLLILNAGAPSLGGIDETLRAQGFEPVVSRPADETGPDQAILEATLALLRPTRIQSTTRYRDSRRALRSVVLVEF